MSSGRKIAILQTAFLGDTLLSVPLAKALLQHEVARDGLLLICRKGLGEFFRALEIFDQVLEVEKGAASSYDLAMRDLESWWASASSRVLLSPHESPRSRVWAARLKMRAQFRSSMGANRNLEVIGYRSQPFGIFSSMYSKAITRPMALPEALRQLALLQADTFLTSDLWRERLAGFALDQGTGRGGVASDGSLMAVPEWASMSIPRFASLGRDPKRIAMAPGSVWKTKQWTKAGFAEVGRAALQSGMSVDLVGTKDERVLCQEIVELIVSQSTEFASHAGSRVANHAGELTLLQTTDVLARAGQAFVNDSGAMHLAALSGTPVVSFFGPTVLDFGYRPWSQSASVLEPPEKLKCRPCGKHGSQSCPIGTHECMKSIQATRAISLLKINP